MTSTVVQNSTNPVSNPLQFHRLVTLGKLIPVDDFLNLLVEKNIQFTGLQISNN